MRNFIALLGSVLLAVSIPVLSPAQEKNQGSVHLKSRIKAKNVVPTLEHHNPHKPHGFHKNHFINPPQKSPHFKPHRGFHNPHFRSHGKFHKPHFFGHFPPHLGGGFVGFDPFLYGGYGTTLGERLERKSNIDINSELLKLKNSNPKEGKPSVETGEIRNDAPGTPFKYTNVSTSKERPVIYVWTDGNGAKHFTDDPDVIPPKFKNQAQKAN